MSLPFLSTAVTIYFSGFIAVPAFTDIDFVESTTLVSSSVPVTLTTISLDTESAKLFLTVKRTFWLPAVFTCTALSTYSAVEILFP